MFRNLIIPFVLWLVEKILFLPPAWLETRFPVKESVVSHAELVTRDIGPFIIEYGDWFQLCETTHSIRFRVELFTVRVQVTEDSDGATLKTLHYINWLVLSNLEGHLRNYREFPDQPIPVWPGSPKLHWFNLHITQRILAFILRFRPKDTIPF